MKIAILGSTDSGKKSLFDLLTEGKESKIGKTVVGTANVSDQRIDVLSNHFHPKKISPGQLNFISLDLEPVFPFEELKTAEELVFVIRTFPAYDGEDVDPLKQYEDFDTMLRIKDMDLMERFVERNHKDPKRSHEVELVKKINVLIEDGKPCDPKEIENDIVSNLGLVSIIPKLVVCNVSENQIQDNEIILEFKRIHPNLFVIPVCVSVEEELIGFDQKSKLEMLSAYEIKDRAIDLFIQKSYEMLGLINFFTVGEDEVKAWTIRNGSNAYKASGKIHTDIQKGFIRAEIVHYNDFIACHCSFKEAKDKGLFHLEGKEYIVQDGDIMHVRFNV